MKNDDVIAQKVAPMMPMKNSEGPSDTYAAPTQDTGETASLAASLKAKTQYLPAQAATVTIPPAPDKMNSNI